MFNGEQTVHLATAQPEAAVFKRVEEALAVLGRARIDKRGAVEIEPKAKFTTFLTATTMEGAVHKKGDGYEVVIDFACKPSLANWLVLTVGTLACWGLNWLALLGPAMDRKAVAKAVRAALLELEEGGAG